MNCVSRRDYDKISDCNIRETLIANLAARLQYVATSDADRKKGKNKIYPRQVLNAAFGEYWYKLPWNDLMRLMKVLPVCENRQYATYVFRESEYNRAKLDIEEHNNLQCFASNAQKIKRIFGKAESDRYMRSLEWCRDMRDRNIILGKSIIGYRNMRKIDTAISNFVKKKDGGAKICYEFFIDCREINNKQVLDNIPEYLRDDIAKQYKKYSMLYYAKGNYVTMQECRRHIGGIDMVLRYELSRVVDAARKQSWQYGDSAWRNKWATSCANRIAQFYRDKEICDILDKLGLHDMFSNVYGANKLNSKFASMVRTVWRSKTSDISKRQVIINLADNMREQFGNFDKNGYIPSLAIYASCN